jgi:hypothetical protein
MSLGHRDAWANNIIILVPTKVGGQKAICISQ